MTNTIQTIDHVIDIEENQYYIKAPGVESVAVASIYKPTAGAKGWYIKSWNPVSGTDDTFYMELIDEDGQTVPESTIFVWEESGQIKKATLSARATFSANYALKVLSVENVSTCKLKVQYTNEFKAILENASQQGQDNWNPGSHLYTDPVKGYVWKPSAPTAGSVEIGSGAMSIGSNNKANEWGSFAAGDENEVDGRYALANGQNNKVAYGAAAIGHGNNVYGYDAIAVGQGNTLRNWRTAAFGESNSMSAKNGFVSGRENWVTASAHEGISVRGVCAVTQRDSTYIDIVGAGTDSTHQKNAYALKPNGEVRVGGDVYIRCNDDSSGGINLNPTLDSVYENTISSDQTGPLNCTLSKDCRYVMVIIKIPRKTVNKTYRVAANLNDTRWGGQVTVNSASSGWCQVMFKLDYTRGWLMSEWAASTGSGEDAGMGPVQTYMTSRYEQILPSNKIIENIYVANITTGDTTLYAGTRIKIYGY